MTAWISIKDHPPTGRIIAAGRYPKPNQNIAWTRDAAVYDGRIEPLDGNKLTDATHYRPWPSTDDLPLPEGETT